MKRAAAPARLFTRTPRLERRPGARHRSLSNHSTENPVNARVGSLSFSGLPIVMSGLAGLTEEGVYPGMREETKIGLLTASLPKIE
jgi:hypothetical protein